MQRLPWLMQRLPWLLICVILLWASETLGQGTGTFYNIDNILFVDGTQYATCNAAITAAGSNPRLIVLPSTYAGANCTNIPATVAILDLRGNATNWPTNVSVPGGHVISFNGNQEGAIQGLGVNSNFTSPTTTAQAITATNQVTGTLPNAYTISAIVGELDVVNAATPGGGTMVGIESFNSLNSTAGGTFPLWWSITSGGRMGSANTSNLSIWGAVHADAFAISGTGSVTDAYGFYGEGQSVATRHNYAAYLIPNHGSGSNYGALLIGYDSTNGAPIDFQDSGGSSHRGIYVDTSGNINIDMQQTGGGGQINFNQNGHSLRAFVNNAGLNTPAGSSLVVGGGSPINKILNGRGSLSFGTVPAQTCVDASLGVTGASTTNFGVFASPGSNPGANLSWSAWVSGTNVAVVRLCNGTQADIVSNNVTWGVTVNQ